MLSYSVGYLFTLLIVSYGKQEDLSLLQLLLPGFAFVAYVLGLGHEVNNCSSFLQCFLYILLISSILSGVKYSPFVHLELIIVCDKRHDVIPLLMKLDTSI